MKFFVSNLFCFNRQKVGNKNLCIEIKEECTPENCPHSLQAYKKRLEAEGQIVI